MNQPELGRKIVELRKAKGLTQEELVEKCNLSVRTLQRIESGEVTPRSYTIRQIFSALDYNIHSSSNGIHDTLKNSSWLEQTYKYVIELFNLKTNTLKKVTILIITSLIIAFGLFALCSESKSQTVAKVKKELAINNRNFLRWFNSGKVDSLASLYRDDACIFPNHCGKPAILSFFRSNTAEGFKYLEIETISVNVCDSIAVERGSWVIQLESGEQVKGYYLTEWHKTNGKWLTVNDIGNKE